MSEYDELLQALCDRCECDDLDVGFDYTKPAKLCLQCQAIDAIRLLVKSLATAHAEAERLSALAQYWDDATKHWQAEADRLKGVLGEVMEWIDNWQPPFTQDGEWAATELKARKALEAKP